MLKCPYCNSIMQFNDEYDQYECSKCGLRLGKYFEKKNSEHVGYMHYIALRREYEWILKRLRKIEKILSLASDDIKRKALAEEI